MTFFDVILFNITKCQKIVNMLNIYTFNFTLIFGIINTPHLALSFFIFQDQQTPNPSLNFERIKSL